MVLKNQTPKKEFRDNGKNTNNLPENGIANQINSLEKQIISLTSLVETQQEQIAKLSEFTRNTPQEISHETTKNELKISSRRNLLRMAGMGAAAAVTSGILARSGTASASTGPLLGQSNSVATAGVEGDNSTYGDGVYGTSVSGNGVHGVSNVSVGGGVAVAGDSKGTGANFSYGVQGTNDSTTDLSAGVVGVAKAITGMVYGTQGINDSTTDLAAGVIGQAKGTSGLTFGVRGENSSISDSAAGVSGYASGATGLTFGVAGTTGSSTTGAVGTYGEATASSGATIGVQGNNSSTTPGSMGVFGLSAGGIGGVFASGYSPIRLVPSNTTLGQPTSNNHQLGEIFVDSAGTFFICTKAGTNSTPGTWKRLQTIDQGLQIFSTSTRVFNQAVTNGQTITGIDATAGGSGIPAGARAMYCAVQSSNIGSLTLYADGGTDPMIVNWSGTTTYLNLDFMFVPLSSAGKFAIHSYITGKVYIDAWGYFI